MRVLMLTRYQPLSAASRLRFYQYLPFLELHGVEVTPAPLLTDADLARLYSTGRRGLVSTFSAYLKRAAQLFGRYDLLWIEKELFPMLPALAEYLLRTPYVVDYDDAVFHNYDLHRSAFVRRALSGKIDAVMRRAALVVAGNAYLATRARLAGAQWVEVLPTVIDITRYTLAAPPPPPITIGWIGSPSTSKYVEMLAPLLQELCAGGQARLLTIGAKNLRLPPAIPHENRDWAEEREVRDIQAMHIGIMPLPDEPWERGKCGYKLIQYMACGLPVVASAVGVNIELAADNGFAADSADEWREALFRLRDDAALRAQWGAAGRRKIEAGYTLQVSAPRLLDLLRHAAQQ
ncbi:MAG: glycosyltransferase family 4 protein [Chloroflexi bacterium]|nr:glycosyltransferase family 4 protein [Chloroflexota bacterium]